MLIQALNSYKQTMKAQPKQKIPVTILTGFLGSGKTTLLNHILTAKHGLKIAVIENQFGEVGVDNHLVKQNVYSQEQVIQTMNGCICCTVRGDLSKIIKRLLIQQKRKFDAIIIQTTGMADPAPVAQTFFVDDDVATYTTLDGIITVVDCKHIIQHLKEQKPEGAQNESIQQIAFADRIILNKTDLVNAQELEIVKKEIKAINSEVQIIPSQYSKVDPNRLMGIEAFNLKKVLEMDSEFLNVDQEHVHDQSITSCGCTFKQPISLGKLQNWISELIQTKSNDLFRYKGIINVVGMDSPYVFQGVHMLFSGNFIKDGWSQTKQRQTNFCFIGKNIDKEYLINGFKDCIAQKLSYNVGDKVQCKVSSGPLGWKEGVIIAQWDQGNPYRIKLMNGDEVHCPNEIPQLIRLKERAKIPPLPDNLTADLLKVELIKAQANSLFTLQNYPEAIEKYKQGCKILSEIKIMNEKQQEDTQDLMIKLKKNIALCLLRTSQFEDSIKFCDETLKLNPEDSKSLYIKGQAYFALGNIQKAIQFLQQAQKISNNPQIATALQKCKKSSNP